MVRRVVFGVILSCMLFQAVWAGELYVREVRGWRRWNAQITKVEFSSTIDGLFARNQMTLSIKDTLSTSYFDSLEAVFNFDLPKDAVIDSMYLWINGKPEPAYLKCAWNATIIYETIVNRRIDPALLKKNGITDNYTIQIFPFMPREERTIKICYTTILSPFAGNLLHKVPLDIIAPSCFPTEDIFSKTMIIDVATQDVSVYSNNQGEYEILSVPNGTQVQFIDHNNIYGNQLHVYINYNSYSEDGYMVNFSKDTNGETFFTALLNPGKVLDIEQANTRKVLIIWNNVMLYQKYKYINGVYRPYPVYRYYYHPYPNSYYNYRKDRADILSFLTTCLKPGDQFNLVMNNHAISSFKNELVPFSGDSYFEVADFLDSSLPTFLKDSGCTSPLEALSAGVSSLENQDSVVIIVIDKQGHYYNGGHDTTAITSQVNGIINLLPKTKSIFWCIQTNGRSYITESYQNIKKVTPGLVIPTYISSPVALSLQSVAHYLSEKIYPANITFSDPNTRYPYDIIGPSMDNLYSRLPCIYTGKIYESKKMKVEFNGVVQGENHTFSKTFTIKNGLTSIPAMSDFWAGMKVDDILSRNNPLVSDKKQALNTSLQYRILTSLTALLALEKWLADSLNMADDKPMQSDTLFIIDENNSTGTEEKPVTVAGAKVSMTCIYAQNNLAISIPHFTQVKSRENISLKIYDMKGRLKVDLTDKLIGSRGTVKWQTESLSSGMYIVRLQIGDTVINKQVLITR